MSRLKIALLGPLQVAQDDRPLTGFEYDKVRALLAYLVLEADRPHRREALAGLLWPNQPEKTARDGLRNALATLRKAIGDDTANPPYLFITREAVQFNAGSDHFLDATEFEHLSRHATHHRHRHPNNCRDCAGWRRAAADLYRGPLLAQFSLADSVEFEVWLLARREALHRVAMSNFEWLASYHLRQGEHEAARFFAGRQLAYEPWHEPAHRQAMLALARLSDRGAALKQYQACVRALDEELGVMPEEETTLLFEQIRDEGLLPERPAPVVVAPLAPLIGRERDLAALDRLLADPGVRLVTILGPGGSGKTSLAQAAGHHFGADFADGSAFVSLITANNPDEFFPTIAAALGVQIDPALPIEYQVTNYLQSRDMLLVLDNFEQLLDGASVLARLLAAAPGLVLLVTSRQRLNLAAEWLHDLHGLAFPAMDTTEPLSGFGALQLFARRARQERGDFALVSAEATAAAEICRLVQGMPLAIELAAAATGIQPTAEIARQLRSGLDALAAEWADLPPRHRSIRAAFEHSWTTLSGDERRVLRQLSVFSGGFDADAAGAVTGATPADLRHLRDKSLLQIRDGGRFDLHPLIRAYAAERLAARGETKETARQHLEYFTSIAEQGEQAIKGHEQLVWLRRLESDHANILAALTWAEAHDYPAAARLAAAMWLFWFMRGHLHESRARYEHLYTARTTLPVHSRARLLNGYASTVMGQGAMGELSEIAGEALACYREWGNNEGIALSYHHLAIAVRARGDLDAAAEYGSEGILAARRSLDNHPTWVLSILLSNLSATFTTMKRLAEAETLAREDEDLCSARGDKWAWAYSLLRIVDIQKANADSSSARENLLKILAVAEEYGDRRLIGYVSMDLALIAISGDDLGDAWRRAEITRQVSLETGERLSRAEALEMLGDILTRRGFPAEAALRYQEARETYAAAGKENAAGLVAAKLAGLTLAER